MDKGWQEKHTCMHRSQNHDRTSSLHARRKVSDHQHKVSDHQHKVSDHQHKVSDHQHRLQGLGEPSGLTYAPPAALPRL